MNLILNRAHPLASGLTVYVPFLEGSGPPTNYANPAQQLTTPDAFTWNNGVYGSQLSLAAAQIAVPQSPATSPSTGWTIAFAGQGSGYPTGNSAFGGRGNGTTGYILWTHTSGNGDTTIWNNASSVTWSGAWPSDGLPHILVGTYDGTNAKLYRDGLLISSQALAGGAITGISDDYLIGAYSGAGADLNLNCAMTAFWKDRVLGAAEVELLNSDPFCLMRPRPRDWLQASAVGGGTTRGMPFGTRSTAFNGGRTFAGVLR